MGSFERGKLQGLSRPDKTVSGGEGPVLWGPVPDRWRDHPGFWEPCRFFRHAVGPVFAITILDRGRDAIPLACTKVRWIPAYTLKEYESPHGLRILERKTVTPSGALVSELRLEADRDMELLVAMWTVQPETGKPLVEDTTISLPRILPVPPGASDHVWLSFAISRPEARKRILPSQSTVHGPWWELSALRESFEYEGQYHQGNDALFACFEDELVLRSNTPGRILGCAVLGTHATTTSREAGLLIDPRTRPIEESLESWERFLEGVPRFSCSDEYFEQAYWYRWIGLRLALQPAAGCLPYRAICEGPGTFRRAISYSLPAHLREFRWHTDAAFGRDAAQNFFELHEESGRIPGIIDTDAPCPGTFYHTDWGGGVQDFLSVHYSKPFQNMAYHVLSQYAVWLRSERDSGNSGLYRIENQLETGQEYSSRYTAVSPDADTDSWGTRFQLLGVDATTYAYRLNRYLSRSATHMGRDEDASRWGDLADRIKLAVNDRMWDPGREMYYDINPASGRRTGIKAGACFYPFMTDIPGEPQVSSLYNHLLDPAEFLTTYPFPSLSLDDPLFSASGRWKGRRMNCPWNGRSWPMLNCHLVDALVRTGGRLDAGLLEYAAEILKKNIHMLFHDGDASRPGSHEHYNPLTGYPSLYRCIDDYMHSWIMDQIITCITGIQPDFDGETVIRPLPVEMEHAEITGVRIRDRSYDVEVRNGRIIACSVDDETIDVPSGGMNEFRTAAGSHSE